MKQITKRTISLLLSLTLLFSMMPNIGMTANAAIGMPIMSSPPPPR